MGLGNVLGCSPLFAIVGYTTELNQIHRLIGLELGIGTSVSLNMIVQGSWKVPSRLLI